LGARELVHKLTHRTDRSNSGNDDPSPAAQFVVRPEQDRPSREPQR